MWFICNKCTHLLSFKFCSHVEVKKSRFVVETRPSTVIFSWYWSVPVFTSLTEHNGGATQYQFGFLTLPIIS